MLFENILGHSRKHHNIPVEKQERWKQHPEEESKVTEVHEECCCTAGARWCFLSSFNNSCSNDETYICKQEGHSDVDYEWLMVTGVHFVV